MQSVTAVWLILQVQMGSWLRTLLSRAFALQALETKVGYVAIIITGQGSSGYDLFWVLSWRSPKESEESYKTISLSTAFPRWYSYKETFQYESCNHWTTNIIQQQTVDNRIQLTYFKKQGIL
jgi:hypothetical protein